MRERAATVEEKAETIRLLGQAFRNPAAVRVVDSGPDPDPDTLVVRVMVGVEDVPALLAAFGFGSPPSR